MQKTSYVTSTPVVTKFVGEMYEETDNVGTIFIFLGSQRVAAIDTISGSPMYYHMDHLGSTNVMSDSNGNVAELLEYDPYGKIHRHDNLAGNTRLAKQQFTGKKLDDETGLIYFGARYYDPTLGRFITADTIVQNPSDPQTLNRYSYCGNNPINRIDPDGHKWSWGKFWKAAVGALVSGVVFALSGGTATPVIAGFWAGMAGGAVTGALTGGWKGMLIGAGMGALGGAALGGIGSWGVDKFGQGFGYGMLAAAGGYSAATGNLDSFTGGLLGGILGSSMASGYLDAKNGTLSEKGPNEGIRAGVSAENNENWAFLGVTTTDGKAQVFANENQMTVIYHKSKGILSDLFRAGFKRIGVSGPYARQSANYLNVAEGKFILAHSEGTLNLGSGIKLATANGVKFNDVSIKWIGPVMSRSTATSLSNSIGAQSTYLLNAGDPIGVFTTFNPVQSAIYGGVGLATMIRYHSTDAYVR